MKKLILMAAMVAALALAGTAAAALTPWTFVGTGANCAPTSTFSGGVLHLSKPCTTATNASAGATVTGVSGQTFTSASFTLASPAQCQGGSPRFNVVAGGKLWFTYSGNPLCTFVGLQVLRYAQAHGLFEEVAAKGERLRAVLGQLAGRHEIIGDVRGLGLFAGVEIVADREALRLSPAACTKASDGSPGVRPADRAGQALALSSPSLWPPLSSWRIMEPRFS